MGYDPTKPMEGRISDLGPPHYEQFFPPVIKENKGKWLWHEITQPGVLMHKSETGAQTLLRFIVSKTDKAYVSKADEAYCGGTFPIEIRKLPL